MREKVGRARSRQLQLEEEQDAQRTPQYRRESNGAEVESATLGLIKAALSLTGGARRRPLADSISAVARASGRRGSSSSSVSLKLTPQPRAADCSRLPPLDHPAPRRRPSVDPPGGRGKSWSRTATTPRCRCYQCAYLDRLDCSGPPSCSITMQRRAHLLLIFPSLKDRSDTFHHAVTCMRADRHAHSASSSRNRVTNRSRGP